MTEDNHGSNEVSTDETTPADQSTDTPAGGTSEHHSLETADTSRRTYLKTLGLAGLLGAAGLASTDIAAAASPNNHEHLGQEWVGNPAGNHGLKIKVPDTALIGESGDNGYGVVSKGDAKVTDTLFVDDIATIGDRLTLRVPGVAGFEIDANGNISAGYGTGVLNASASLATISGGKFNFILDDDSAIGGGYQNLVIDAWGTIAGGRLNQAGSINQTVDKYATVGGGYNNEASGVRATVGGGGNNEASHEQATVGGGEDNTASKVSSTVGGGEKNTASGEDSTIGGGDSNTASDFAAMVGGGFKNKANKSHAVISGGIKNTASGYNTTVGGGWQNKAIEAGATVAGGYINTASGRQSIVSGGKANEASGHHGTVGGGFSNVVYNEFGTVGGGENNQAGGNARFNEHAAVGGGRGNKATANGATIGGGSDNTASGSHAIVGGGYGNMASGNTATVPGGFNNTASGRFSFAAGTDAKAIHDGAFVFGDSSPAVIKSVTSDEARFQMPIYAPAFRTTSARVKKTAIEPVDPAVVLQTVKTLDVSTWKLDHQDDGRHMGPMAEDFAAAFDLGDDDTHIATVDVDGVALAAIQGLAAENDEHAETVRELEEENEAKDLQIADLRADNDDLREHNATLEDRLDAVEERLAGLEPDPAA